MPLLPLPHTASPLSSAWQVLSVDDDPVNQMVIQTMLSKAGFKVLKAADGQKALDMLDVSCEGVGVGGRRQGEGWRQVPPTGLCHAAAAPGMACPCLRGCEAHLPADACLMFAPPHPPHPCRRACGMAPRRTSCC